MSFSSRKWAGIISLVASYVYFYIIFTQVPLFRFPCRIGVCRTPVEITASQLIATDIFAEVVVKSLLYPGAIKKSFVKGTKIPGHEQLLKAFKSRMRKAPALTDLKHLEVAAGSYLCVAGALLGLIKQGRMSLFGSCLILWGFTREIVFSKYATHRSEGISVYPRMVFALALAVCSVRRDVKKFLSSFKPKQVAKKVKSYSKAKYN